MFEKLRPNFLASGSIERKRTPNSTLDPRGAFYGTLYRDGKPIFRTPGKNGIVTVGKNHLLDVVFSGGSAVATWYIGLINNAGFAALLDADTLASHTGWAELIPGTDYTGNRQAWVEGAASAGSKTSSSDATFPILTTKGVYGIFLCSVASGTSGTLMATGGFDSVINVQNGDSLKIAYTISY